jgi:hypothetical protein
MSILLVKNNRSGILLLRKSVIVVVVRRIIEYVRKVSKVTTNIHRVGRVTVDI